MKILLGLAVALLLATLTAACSSGGGATTTSAPPSSSATTSSAPTFGQYSDAGKAVFAARCAKCHGNNGEGVTGPALIGSAANLAKYNTSQALLGFFSTTMPFDAPGSLSSSDYQNLLAFLLVQNGYLSAGAAFDANTLNGVQLKK